jgi:nucleoside-diphosphate-sugar epimerase
VLVIAAEPDLAAADALPERIADVAALEELMTRPSPPLIADLAAAPGDILILGVGGKMGPTLARLAKRAAPRRRIVGVARFSEPGLREKLLGWGIECLAADLLDREAVARLPDLPNVIYMAGRKFGTSGAEELTWAMNVHVPAMVAERFAHSRLVAFSTGCVYPYVAVDGPGAGESTPAVPPPGAYANSCLGREQMFRYFSRRHGTPGRIIRLNYAIDMRYGVLHDIARRILGGKSIDVTTGHFNCIWQGDANSQVLRALRHVTTPTSPLNVSGPERASVRAVASALADRLGRPVAFAGSEAATAWLVDTAESRRLFGVPTVPLEKLIDWTASWFAAGGASLDKPTHFDVRDGRF